MESFVDSRYQSVKVLIRSRAVESAEVAALLDRVEDRLSELPGHIAGRVTGSTALVTRTIDDIALGQALSLGSAFVIIFAILALLFFNYLQVRVGAISGTYARSCERFVQALLFIESSAEAPEQGEAPSGSFVPAD